MLKPKGRPRRVHGIDSLSKSELKSTPALSYPRPNSPAFVYHKRTAVKKRRFDFNPRPFVLAGIALAVLFGFIAFLKLGTGKFKLSSLVASGLKAAVGQTTVLKGQAQDRTNIVFYGMTQDGMRTDSIILTSYYYKDKKLTSINIPRDLYTYDGYENAKMGEIYAYARLRQPKTKGYPEQYVADVLSKEYGIPIHYWVRVNMQGEVDLINSIGGIDVNIANSFKDYEYPKWDYSGYIRPAPYFTAGPTHLDGATALIYSRSRHSLDNGEGTDFARSKRQTQVISGIMTKLKAQGIVGNLSQISHYLDILGSNVDTSMSSDEMVGFAKLAKDINPTQNYTAGNWSTGNGFLCDGSTSAGAYVTMYGVPGSCDVGAGGYHDSKYRQYAIYYVQHMEQSASLDAQTFVQTASTALYGTPAPGSAASSAKTKQ